MPHHYDISWLASQLNDHQPVSFLFFYGHTKKAGEEVGSFCFSQWYELPFTVEGITYKTAEHWMMAHKALLFGDEEIYARIIAAARPGEAKKLGRQVKNFDEAIWNKKRSGIVVQVNIYKFGQHPACQQYLLDTGEHVIVEASPTDRIWGIGLSKDHPAAYRPYQWKGLNLLGFALMEVRDFLKNN